MLEWFIVGLLVGGVIGMIIMGYLCASDKGRVL